MLSGDYCTVVAGIFLSFYQSPEFLSGRVIVLIMACGVADSELLHVRRCCCDELQHAYYHTVPLRFIVRSTPQFPNDRVLLLLLIRRIVQYLR